MVVVGLFSAFSALCERLAAAGGRLEKRRLVAEYLASLASEDVPRAVAFLSGRPFPSSDPRTLNVRGLPRTRGDAVGPPLTLDDVAVAFSAVAAAGGAGSRRAREERLAALAARASAPERDVLHRIITGEMRTGVSDGRVLSAIAPSAAAGVGRAGGAVLFLRSPAC